MCNLQTSASQDSERTQKGGGWVGTIKVENLQALHLSCRLPEVAISEITSIQSEETITNLIEIAAMCCFERFHLLIGSAFLSLIRE